MATFKEKLDQISEGKNPTTKSLTFLSDISLEDRTTFRQVWPKIPVARRRQIIETLVTLAEDNIEYYFRPVFLSTLEDADGTVRLASIEGLFEDESAMLLDRLLYIL